MSTLKSVGLAVAVAALVAGAGMPAVQAAPAGELSGWALVTGGLELPAPVGMPTYADVATVAGEESVPRTLLLPVFPAPGAATTRSGR